MQPISTILLVVRSLRLRSTAEADLISGMGLTTGLTDAAALGDALVARIKGDAGDEILERYSAERKKVFDAVSNPTSQQFKKIAQSTPEEVAELEKTYFKRLNDDEEFAKAGLMSTYRLLTRF